MSHKRLTFSKCSALAICCLCLLLFGQWFVVFRDLLITVTLATVAIPTIGPIRRALDPHQRHDTSKIWLCLTFLFLAAVLIRGPYRWAAEIQYGEISIAYFSGSIAISLTEHPTLYPPSACGSRQFGKSEQFMGLSIPYYRDLRSPIGRHRRFLFPMWILLVTIQVWFISRLFYYRRKLCKLNCINCKYNLFGNSSGICPECGAPIPEEQGRTITALAKVESGLASP